MVRSDCSSGSEAVCHATLIRGARASEGKTRAGVSFTIYGMLFVFAAIAMVNILIVMTKVVGGTSRRCH